MARVTILIFMRTGAVLAATLWLLMGCQSLLAGKYDVNSRYYSIHANSRLVLHQAVDIPAGRAHVVFQHGRIVAGANQYAVNCEYEVRNLGPAQINPDSFIIYRS